jgi:GxxExxY protein
MTGNEEESLDADGYALIGAAFDVYNNLGAGFLEEVYQEAMEMELIARKMPFISKPRLFVFYKDHQLQKYYEADLFVSSRIVVELKAVRTLAPEHHAQLLNELRATRQQVGYLINFGAAPRLEWIRRVV